MSFQLLLRPVGRDEKKGKFKRREEATSLLMRYVCETPESWKRINRHPQWRRSSKTKLPSSMENILLESCVYFDFVFSQPFGLCVYPSSLPGPFKAYLPMPPPPQTSAAINQQQGWRGQTEEPLRLHGDCFSLSWARRLLLLQMDDGSG